MEESLKQLMEMLSAVKASQEEMKTGQEKMKVSQEEMKEDMMSSQQKLEEKLEDNREYMKRGQEEMKANQEELKQKLEDKLQEMKITIEDSNTKLENKLREFEEVVEEEINQVKEEVKAVEGELSHIQEDKKEINKEIEDLETKVRQLSTTGVIKREGTLTTPSKVKVPTYDGKASWNTYLRQFEAVVRNWREEDKATSLIAALRGEALEVLRTITEANPNYTTLTSALERRYGDAHLQHVYQAQLRSRRQRFEETLQQYEADISRMVNLAYPKAPAEVIEQLSVSSFIEGLRDPEIGQLVRLARPKTISEALAQALEIEAAKEASRFAINPYQVQEWTKPWTLYPEWRKKTNSLLDVSEGHVRRQCPQTDSLLKAPGPSTSQVKQIRVHTRQNQDAKMKKTHTYLDDWMYQILKKREESVAGPVATEGHLRSRCPQSNSDGENPDGSYIHRVQERRPMVYYQAPPPEKIPWQCNGASLAVPGRVCGRECKMIVDTGSSRTIVRPNIVAHCKMQDTEEKYLLETARGEAIPVKGVHLAEIKIGKKTFKQKVFVADITDDVLLGLDVMSKDFLLDLPRGIMKISNEEVHLNVLKTEVIPTRRVRIVEDATLLPEPEVPDELRCNHQDSKNEEVLVVELQSKLRRPIRELIHHRRGNKECADDNLHKKRKSGRDSMKTCHDLRSRTCGFKLGKMLPQGTFTMITRMKDNVNRMHKDLKTKMEIVYIGLTFHQESSPNEGVT
ncbi:hypothetical protein NQ315_003497 [Exocentrus adspersus]|uniref:Paraneoplastic antigen Ma-like C-terminal domain-containing protein n=1 Tax=Exocentrus adspersus TaxID=1586481 RepID=A0AAV8V7I0_9CUCU|nr:hypothetical protein NQ315_003497 [Exocentrus adspersus]